MDQSILRSLNDKVYEKRKTAALDLERIVREAAAADDLKKLDEIIQKLCELVASPHSNSRSGAIMGLAGVAIALGPKIADHLAAIVPPVFACFHDSDSKVRYFACESMYNIAKVAKGEILVFFNELFDAMSKLAADTELPVKNGAELLDRLIKDIVTEQASTYVSVTASTPPVSPGLEDKDGTPPQPERAFSLVRFIPLLRERIYVLNPFTRTYLVSWLMVLDSVPELELVSYLPEFLDGLLKYLGDPTVDIRTATQNVLADFLREIREVAEVHKMHEEESQRREEERARRVTAETSDLEPDRRPSTYSAGKIQEGKHEDESPNEERNEDADVNEQGEEAPQEEEEEEDEDEDEDAREWIPGEGVVVDHAAIVEILIEHLSFPDEEIQSTCLRWIAEFLLFAQPVMVPFTPRLIPVILSSLAHHVSAIRTAAGDTNDNLFSVIQALAVPEPPNPPPAAHLSPAVVPPVQGKPSDQTKDGGPPSRGRSLPSSSPPMPQTPFASARLPSTDRSFVSKAAPAESVVSPTTTSHLDHDGTRSRTSTSEGGYALGEGDPFDYGATVNALTLQFLNEHEETRVAALDWLLMLHQKAPKKILAIDDPSADGTRTSARARAQLHSDSGLSIALLLKMLSDPSERVLRHDLQLLAQISSSAEDEYFPNFMMSLLSLFSTDRRLLETRGSLIIRQLCSSLNTERIYRTFAEILEKDEDLEFASIMVQNLNLIMITSPELAEFRKRLKNLESRDGQALFTVLYKTWSQNAVATFSLCLLAQAYEQACALLQIFADLEITVGLLIQIDKLVQLLESPVFTSLRLQLLEPERYPYLLKAMYGLLMLLPQSSAFATLRNRLSAVSSLGFLQTVPRSSYASATGASSTSAPARISSGGLGSSAQAGARRGGEGAADQVRWNELLTHFRTVQKRRASAAAQLVGGDSALDGIGTGMSAASREVAGLVAGPTVVANPGGIGAGAGPVSGKTAANGTASPLASSAGGTARRKLGSSFLPRTDSGTTIKGASLAGGASQGTGSGWRTPSAGAESVAGGGSTRPTSPAPGTSKRRGPAGLLSTRR